MINYGLQQFSTLPLLLTACRVMTDSFDPYYKWLGIPPKDQPPNDYRLLGLELFEADPEVIDAAANRQMAYIQGCAVGQHVKTSQRLLNEIAAARLRLLDKKKKHQYDIELKKEQEKKQRRRNVSRDSGRKSLAAASKPSSSSSSVAVEEKAPGVVIDTRKAPEPPPVSVAQEQKSVASSRTRTAGAMPTKTKVLIGGMLALGLLSTIVTAAFLFTRGSSPPTAVAQNPKNDSPQDAPDKTTDTQPANDGSETEPEDNLDAIERLRQMNAALNGEDPDAGTTDTATGDGTNTTSTDPDTAVASSTPNTTATENPPATGNKPEDKPEEKPEPSPTPDKPKDPPKTPDKPKEPPKPANPFRTFPERVSLPELAEDADPAEATLGQVQLPKDANLFINMIGGQVDRNANFAMSKAPGTGDTPWQITMTGTNGSVHVADIKLDGKDLKFAWTKQAAAEKDAGLVRNTLLEMRTSTETHYAALREYAKVEPITLSFERRAKNSVDIPLTDAPDDKLLKVEITGLEGNFPPHNFKPSSQFDPNTSRADEVGILLGNPPVLALMVSSRAKSREITLGLEPQFQVTGMQKAMGLEQAPAMLAQVSAAVAQQTNLLNQNKKNLSKEQQNSINAQITAGSQLQTQLQQLAQQCEALNGTGKVHFRVYFPVANKEIDIVRSNDPAPPAAAKKK